MHFRASQTSESLERALILALSGGLMDAYSYLGRDGVFANAQTGNLLLLGVNISTGNWDVVAHYLCPVVAFACGCALAHLAKLHRTPGMHWRQYVLLVEAALLLIVSTMGSDLNLVANSLTSLACGMQVQAFRKLHGRSFATTMCIGNLRSGTQALVTYFDSRERVHLRTAGLYYGVVATFVLGAVLGNWVLGFAGLHTIRVSCVLLVAAFALMFYDRERRARERAERSGADTDIA